MSERRFVEHSTAARLAEAVADDVASILGEAIEARGAALMFAPGGSTPRASFAHLAEMPLDWTRVTALPGDERVAPPEAGLSNFEAMRESFGDSQAELVPLIQVFDDCSLAAREAEDLLRTLAWPPDLVWLGLGEDGHIASIFSCTGEAVDTQRRAVCVWPEPLPAAAPVPRVTLTMPAILSARVVVLAGTGDAKKALLERGPQAGEAALPVHRLLERATQPLFVHWSPT